MQAEINRTANRGYFRPKSDDRRNMVMAWTVGYASCSVGFAFLLAAVHGRWDVLVALAVFALAAAVPSFIAYRSGV